MEHDEPYMIKVAGIHHYTISVADMDQSVKWYREKLGFELITPIATSRTEKITYVQNRGVRLKMVQVSNPNPLPPYRSHPTTDNAVQGHKHFSLRVKDGAQAERELRTLGVSIVFVAVVGDTYGVFISDPTGNLIEVLQEKSPTSPPDPNKVLGVAPISIERWSHAAISVPSTDEAIAWYGRNLGLAVDHADVVAVPDGPRFKITWLKAPNFCLEIFKVPGSAPLPPDRLNPSDDLKTLGNKYFSLGVADISKAERGLKSLSVDIITQTVNDVRSMFIRDNAGIVIEILQVPD